MDEQDLKARLHQSGILQDFVQTQRGKWGHEEWTQLLADIDIKGYSGLQHGAIGEMLEQEKRLYSETIAMVRQFHGEPASSANTASESPIAESISSATQATTVQSEEERATKINELKQLMLERNTETASTIPTQSSAPTQEVKAESVGLMKRLKSWFG